MRFTEVSNCTMLGELKLKILGIVYVLAGKFQYSARTLPPTAPVMQESEVREAEDTVHGTPPTTTWDNNVAETRKMLRTCGGTKEVLQRNC